MTGPGMSARPSATMWVQALAEREVSARELVTQTLERIDAADQEVNAVVARNHAAALDAADAADRTRQEDPESAGPLLGLPVTIKDALDVSGMVTVSGSSGRRGQEPATRDAAAVERLRAAGAIPLLKTNVPELCSSYETNNPVFGRTCNPVDLTRTAGGSSGGEAALLGADASIVGLGSDGGGSIRVPAHFVGVVGLRPTVGLVPETGLQPPTRHTGMMDLTCVGPLARFVDDLGLLLRFIAGPDDHDPYVVHAPPWQRPCRDVSGLRVGFYASHPAVPVTTPGTVSAVRAAACELERCGANVVEMVPPEHPSATVSATALFMDLIAVDGGNALTSASAGSTDHVSDFQRLLDAARAGGDRPTSEFFALKQRAHEYRRSVRSQLAEFDVVLSPVVAGPAPRHGSQPTSADPAGGHSSDYEYVHINAIAGVPAASVPMGSENGMPIGVQVASRPFREDLVLCAAAALERQSGGFAIALSLQQGDGLR